MCRIIFIFSLLLFACSGCGFKPVYSNNINGIVLDSLSQIDVQPIDSINGVECYNRLSNILPVKMSKKYLLTISLTYDFTTGIIQKNSDITRENVKLKVSYTLITQDTGKKITYGEFSKHASYSTIFAPYSNTIKEQDISKNLATSAADEIRNRLIIFFEKHRANEILFN